MRKSGTRYQLNFAIRYRIHSDSLTLERERHIIFMLGKNSAAKAIRETLFKRKLYRLRTITWRINQTKYTPGEGL